MYVTGIVIILSCNNYKPEPSIQNIQTTENIIITNDTMFKKIISVVEKSIFPVFYGKPDGNLEIGIVGIIGTGFFIDNNGHFITAYHVVKGRPAGSKLYYFGNVPTSPTLKFIPIEEIVSDPKRDIFIGKINEYYLPGLKLSFEQAEIGSSVCFGGYPYNILSLNQDGSINVSKAIQHWPD